MPSAQQPPMMPVQPNPMMMGQPQMNRPMMVPGGQVPPMMGMPPQGLPQAPVNAAPQMEYNMQGQALIPAVVPSNPNYRNQVGEFIYEHVEKVVGDVLSPKIAGMLIDLPIPEIQMYLVDFNRLMMKI